MSVDNRRLGHDEFLRRLGAERTPGLVERGLAVGALVVLAPVLLLAALAVYLESGGPVLERRRRTRSDRRPVEHLRFRTVRPIASTGDDIWNIATDPRVGPVGQVLRETAIAELPLLVNVARGELGFFGPSSEPSRMTQ